MRTLALIPFLAALHMLYAQSSNKLETKQERQQHFDKLHSEIFAKDERSESTPITDAKQVQSILSQLHDLVTQQINDGLKASTDTAESLPLALKSFFGDTTPPDATGLTYYARPFVLGNAKGVAVAYELLAGTATAAEPDNYPYFEFYNKENGEWKLKAQAPTQSEFNGCTFFVHPIDSPTKTEVWFLVSGFKIGDTGTRLKVHLYSYDGASLRTVWQRSGLTRGEVSVSNNVITLEYDRKYQSADPDNRVREEFQAVPDGLQCITPKCE